ncbi:MAG: ArsR family transcriptional regulator [Asgard group archaeon]|nr:ArsR family transcriptional regulator [Asgard group archaeon]
MLKNASRILLSSILLIGIVIAIWVGRIAFSTLFFDVFERRMNYTVFALAILFLIITSIGLLNTAVTRDNILNNYTRAKIFTLIKTNPGIHYSEIIRNLKLSNGQATWHLTYLERFDMIRRVKSKQYLVFYPNYDFTLDEEEITVEIALTKSKTRNQIYELICDRPAITQSEIKKIIEISQSTIAYHLIILEQLKLIYIKKKGRKRYYFPFDDISMNLNEENHKQIMKQ